MAKYRKKPVVIDAIQWDSEPAALDLIRFAEEHDCQEEVEWDNLTAGPPHPETGEEWGHLSVRTLESNEHVATPGDWLIRGVRGELYFCKPDVFAATYEPVEVSS